MKAYLDLVRRVLEEGRDSSDRTGTGTRSVFGHQLRANLREGFPLLTTKRLHLKSIIHELLWFLAGETSIDRLKAAGVRIWDPWATEEQCARFGRRPGDLGPVYGHQWRNYGATKSEDGTYQPDGVDQIKNALHQIRNEPDSRRIIVTGWNPAEADAVALPPCHTLFQFYVRDGELSCQLYQRSADVFIGVPFNIASYALLTMMVAQVCDLRPAELVHTFGDAHLYQNHLEQARRQLERDPRPAPIMRINPDVRDLFSYAYADFQLEGYHPHPHIKAEVSV